MTGLCRRLERINEVIGRGIAWLVLGMVLVQFAVVIMRYVFAIGSIPLQESIWYMHGTLFMVAAGYTLLHDGHVRVDIFYRKASPRYRALIDLLGVLVFLLPLCAATWWLSWRYVAHSWAIREGSTEISGLPFIYLLKSVILVFVVLMTIQGLALALRSLLVLVTPAASHSKPGDGR